MAEEKAAPAVEAPVVAKSNLILIVIIAVLATLLIGGGAVAFMTMKGGGAAAEEQVAEADEAPAETEKPAAKKKNAKDKKVEGPKGPAIYVALDPPFVVNFDSAQAARFLQVTVQVMTRDQETAKLVQDNDPMLRNDLLLLFGSQDSASIASREGKDELRKLALETVKTMVKAEGGAPDKIEAVFFTSFVMQ